MNFDRNTILGLVLMLALVIGFSWFNTPSPEERAEQMRLDSLARVEAKIKEETQIQKATEEKV
jgi:YidC/Oxa1 family membrane protein insertase